MYIYIFFFFCKGVPRQVVVHAGACAHFHRFDISNCILLCGTRLDLFIYLFIYLYFFSHFEIGAGNVQKQYISFVILDKLGLLFFCFALLVFCAMWSRAINIMAGDNSSIAVVILITATCFVAAIFAIVVYFAVVVSVTYISMYYYAYVTDYADIVLACITCFLALCLFIQILFIMGKIEVWLLKNFIWL
jgi:hypothetical protein